MTGAPGERDGGGREPAERADATRRERANGRVTGRVFLWVWAVWGVVLAALRVARPGLEIGDGLNDADILHGSRWFDVHGYLGTWFLPTRETSFPVGGAVQLYNTFPPGAFWVHELLKLAGLRELWQFRVAAVIGAQAAVLTLYWIARRMSGSALIAALTAGVYMFSTPYTNYSGGMWEHEPMLSMLGTVAAWLKFEEARETGSVRARRWWFAAAAACAILEAWMSVQHAVMLGVVIGGRAAWIAWREWSAGQMRRAVGVVACAAVVCAVPAVVLGMRFAHQVVVSGSVAAAEDYFRKAVVFRAGLDERSVSRGMAMKVCLKRLGVPLMNGTGVWWTERGNFPAFGPGALVCGGLVVIGLGVLGRRWNGSVVKGLVGGGLLLAGAATWPVVMSQHAALHQFVTLMFMPGASLMLGSLMAAGWIAGEERARSGSERWVVLGMQLAGVALAVVMVRDMRRSELVNAFVRAEGSVAKRVEWDRERFAVIKAAGVKFGEVKGVRALRICPRWPSFAYYLDQPFYQLALPMGRKWNPDETCVVDLTLERTSRAGGNLAAKFGVPDVLSDPAGLAAFPARVSEADRATRSVKPEAEVVPGVDLTEVRWERTVDGGGYAVGLAMRGKLAEEAAGALKVRVELVDGQGASVWVSDPSDRSGIHRGPEGTLVVVQAPKSAGERAAAAGVTIDGLGTPINVTIGLK